MGDHGHCTAPFCPPSPPWLPQRGGRGTTAPPPFDLALGGSGSVGFQPTWGHTHGQPTSSGYAEDLAPHEASRWPGLTLVQIGCPGMTTQTMISGGGQCDYGAGSQLEAALAFLRAHPSTVLVTVDLGFNDLVPCLHHMEVKSTASTTPWPRSSPNYPRS